MNLKSYIAGHVVNLPKSGIRDFFALVSQMKDAISLSIGEPDFVTPWHIREAAMLALEQGKTCYTDNRGLISLRREISAYVQKQFNIEYNPDTEIIIGVGVSELLDAALRALVNPGDKVMYHDPCYVSYAPCVLLAHGIPVPVNTSPDEGFTLAPKALYDAWEPGCKILMLNFPTNPTGGVVERSRLEKIAQFAVEKDLIVLSDEIYSELTFDGEHVSIASLPGMKERTIFLHGFSKAFAMTGFRIGYACGHPELIEAIMKIHQYAIMCAPILSQEAAIDALKNGADAVAYMKESYHKRRDFLVRRFNEIGLTCHLPKGSFYTFPRVDMFGIDEKSFATRLLQEHKVAVVPGTAFGKNGKGYVRACFCTAYEKLIDATDSIDQFVNTLK